MLRKAERGEEAALLGLLAREPLLNLHLIDLLTQGITRQREAWVEEGVGVLARQGAAWYISASAEPGRFDLEAAAAILDGCSTVKVRGLVGPAAEVDGVTALLRRHVGLVHEQTFAVMDRLPDPIPYYGTPRPARAEDLDALIALYADAEDMRAPRSAVEAMLPQLWVVEADGQVTSAAAVLAESQTGAVIGGVFTPEQERGRGFATTLVHAMSGTLQLLGQAPCLYYHNPVAGRIYRRIGYREVAPWRAALF